jgi:CBS domain-containing protein
MQARDIMTTPVLTVGPKAKISQAIDIMLRSHLSGLPVVDANRRLVGMLSEGDLLRRAELGTERHRPRWIETFLMPGRAASDYVHTHGRVVEEIMTDDPITVQHDTPLEEIVSLMERKRIKRVPVVCVDMLVGIVTRADLVRALAKSSIACPQANADDKRIQEAIESDLKSRAWMPGISVRVEVKNGIVELNGIILDDRYRQAIRVCAQNTSGVKDVNDHLVFVEPLTGAYIDPHEKTAQAQK